MQPNPIKGLDIAEDFFLRWGRPYLEQEFPELMGRIAAGRFSGSDVLRADDEISRDHNWGPQFSLYLSQADFDHYGTQLSEQMNRAAPKQWSGTWVDGAGDKNVLVECVSHRIQEEIGFSKIPQTDAEWGIIVRDRRVGGSVEARESALYYLKHGALWLNNNDEFATWRAALAYYPEQVWYARLAEECFRLWQYGEYNFVSRIAQRGEPLAVHLCLGEFAEGVMRMCLLLQKDYTPYWKWLAYAFRNLDCAAYYGPLLESLFSAVSPADQVKLVQQICHDLHQELLSIGVITGKGVSEFAQYLLPLFNAQDELMAKVTWMPALVEES